MEDVWVHQPLLVTVLSYSQHLRRDRGQRWGGDVHVVPSRHGQEARNWLDSADLASLSFSKLAAWRGSGRTFCLQSNGWEGKMGSCHAVGSPMTQSRLERHDEHLHHWVQGSMDPPMLGHREWWADTHLPVLGSGSLEDLQILLGVPTHGSSLGAPVGWQWLSVLANPWWPIPVFTLSMETLSNTRQAWSSLQMRKLMLREGMSLVHGVWPITCRTRIQSQPDSGLCFTTTAGI